MKVLYFESINFTFLSEKISSLSNAMQKVFQLWKDFKNSHISNSPVAWNWFQKLLMYMCSLRSTFRSKLMPKIYFLLDLQSAFNTLSSNNLFFIDCHVIFTTLIRGLSLTSCDLIKIRSWKSYVIRYLGSLFWSSTFGSKTLQLYRVTTPTKATRQNSPQI